MGGPSLESAFESIADVVAKAAQLPDHRERKVPSTVVEMASRRDEVRVIIEDGVIRSLRFDQFWLDGVDADQAADVARAVINDGFREWNRQQLDDIMSVTPDVRELNAAIQKAHSELDQAWATTIAQSKARHDG